MRNQKRERGKAERSVKMSLAHRQTRLPSFFKPLFWSYKFDSIDYALHKREIIINTINYGNWSHWSWIIKKYGPKKVKKFIEEIPETEFRSRALKLISLLLGIKKLKYASRSDYIRAKKNIR